MYINYVSHEMLSLLPQLNSAANLVDIFISCKDRKHATVYYEMQLYLYTQVQWLVFFKL
jgi:hypothetical protein